VKFTPKEGNGVGLSSTVIVIASGEGEISPDVGSEENDSQDSGFNLHPNGNDLNEESSNESSFFASLTPLKVLMISTGTLVLIFIILIIVYSTRHKKSKSEKTEIILDQSNKQGKKRVGRQSGK
jgi:preprotein translocase subunit SecG